MASTTPVEGRGDHAHFHPAVYRAMAGFAALMAAASLAFFTSGGPDSYVYVIVAGFIAAALALPYVLRRVRRIDRRPWRGSVPPAVNGASLGSCSRSAFVAGQDRIRGRDAMIEAVLPIAAVGIGMMLLAVVMLFAVPA